MAKINIMHTELDEVLIIKNEVFSDERGELYELYNKKEYINAGIVDEFVQENICISKKGVLRGLHVYNRFPTSKIVRVISGKVFDVVVDIRRNSETYGKWFGIELSEYNKLQLYIPKGFAHGYLAMTDNVCLSFCVSDFYHKNNEIGIAWNDPCLAIEWPGIEGEYSGTANAMGYTFENSPLIICERDQRFPTFYDNQDILSKIIY